MGQPHVRSMNGSRWSVGSVSSFPRGAWQRGIIVGDREVSHIRRVLLRQLKQAIRRDPERVNAWLRPINTARNLERIADHAASIAEAVIYMREGDIVRHAGASSGEA